MHLPTILKSTLDSLEPLPRSKAAAKRIDPLNRLETELFTLQPFIDLYKKAYCQWAVNPSRLPAFLLQTQLMTARVEAEKQVVRLTCSTDIQGTREVILRQLTRLFDTTLSNASKMRRADEVAISQTAQEVKSKRESVHNWSNPSPAVAVDCPDLTQSCISASPMVLSIRCAADQKFSAPSNRFPHFSSSPVLSREDEVSQEVTVRWT